MRKHPTKTQMKMGAVVRVCLFDFYARRLLAMLWLFLFLRTKRRHANSSWVGVG
jgi:hypothetical protein